MLAQKARGSFARRTWKALTQLNDSVNSRLSHHSTASPEPWGLPCPARQPALGCEPEFEGGIETNPKVFDAEKIERREPLGSVEEIYHHADELRETVRRYL